MEKFFMSLLVICQYLLAHCQSIGIGTSTPSSSAALDITTTGKGLLIPRMSSAIITSISNPAKGLMVYDSVKNQLVVNMGTPVTPNWQNIVSSSDWGLTGNSGTNADDNFIGTIDNHPLYFRVNNQLAGKIDTVSGSTFMGYGAGKNADSQAHAFNTATGFQTLYSNTTGYDNTAIGAGALYSNINGGVNNASGVYPHYTNTAGIGNSANGYQSMYSNTTGNYNTAIGYQSLYSNVSKNYNTATGGGSLYRNTVGEQNTANGYFALYHNDAGTSNTVTGVFAMYQNNSGNYNTALGYAAGGSEDNGYNNVFLGANTDVDGPGYYNVIAIGQGTVCTGSSQVTIGNGATGFYRAYANWSDIGDGRFKKNIQENVSGLDFITQLRPVTYNLNATDLDVFVHTNNSQSAMNNTNKTDKPEEKITAQPYTDAASAVYNKALKEKETTVYTGFVAQEVESTAKKLGFNFSSVDTPKNDKDVYGLRYAEFVVPPAKAVQEQQQTIKDLQKQIEELKALI
jgi:trimeric autotransporter adhesin